MIDDNEKYVRERWKDITTYWGSRELFIKADGARIATFAQREWEDLWISARRFTEKREEEIRQLERDIDRIENYFWSASNWQENLDDLEEQGAVVDAVRQQCADVRIVARLQAALEKLKMGMR